ncbi:MAG: Tm-1-like ATP-binding domain-containing protein [Candidatus Limnocylindrales bacterium]
MARSPRILVAGILDTKGNEIKFLADRVRAAGGEPTIMELSVGGEVGWADIPVSKLLARVGKTVAEVSKLDRGKAVDLVMEGGRQEAHDLLGAGKLDGMIAFGGSMGTSIAAYIMRSLPIGVPKLMLSTMTSGDARPYVGTKDLTMMFPIAEVGLNKVTRTVINNAAAAVVGMANAPALESVAERPLVGCMMFGVTTPTVLRASKDMEERGYDVMVNHAVGSGGSSMEELIADGYIVGMLDITTHEIGDEILGGVLSAGPNRLTAAGLKGIPQVVSVGGLDMINFGARATVPQKFVDEQHLSGRSMYIHNPTVTAVGITADETYTLGRALGEKLNVATGPTALVVPLRGWGAVDLAVPDKDLGWAGPDPGPMWVADKKNPEWSMRNEPFLKGLRETLDLSKPNVDVLLVDRHMNEPEFADLMADLLTEMLDGKWRKGSHQESPRAVPLSAV